MNEREHRESMAEQYRANGMDVDGEDFEVECSIGFRVEDDEDVELEELLFATPNPDGTWLAEQYEESEDKDVREIAEWLHNEYEDIASEVGWNTQDGTSVAFDDLPEDNREVMLHLAGKVLQRFSEHQ